MLAIQLYLIRRPGPSTDLHSLLKTWKTFCQMHDSKEGGRSDAGCKKGRKVFLLHLHVHNKVAQFMTVKVMVQILLQAMGNCLPRNRDGVHQCLAEAHLFAACGAESHW